MSDAFDDIVLEMARERHRRVLDLAAICEAWSDCEITSEEAIRLVHEVFQR